MFPVINYNKYWYNVHKKYEHEFFFVNKVKIALNTFLSCGESLVYK